MKKLAVILLCLVSAFEMYAQDEDIISNLNDDFADLDTIPEGRKFKNYHLLGVQYYYNISSGVKISPSVGETTIKTDKNIAILYTYYHSLWDTLPYFGLQFGAKYGEEGFASEYGYGEICKILEFPLIAQCRIDFSMFRLLVNAGCYGGYRLDTNKLEFDKYDQRYDYGIIAGGGLAIVVKPFELHLECNYKYALASMYHTNKLSDMYWTLAYPRNIMLSAGIFVNLW